MAGLEGLGRVRLSQNFFFRDFLHSEIASFYGLPNIPQKPDIAVRWCTRLCEELLEPLQATFGRITVRSGYRAPNVIDFGHKKLGRGSIATNAAYHIWDMPDKNGYYGAAASIVIPWFADRYAEGADWRALAWWIHDHLPYSHLEFYPKLCAFNTQWHDGPLVIQRIRNLQCELVTNAHCGRSPSSSVSPC